MNLLRPYWIFALAILLFSCASKEEIHLGALQHFNRGNELLEQRLYKQAVHEYRAAIALEDDQEVFFYNLGLSYYNLRLYEKSAEEYQRAIDLNPEFGEAWYNLSLALNKLGQSSDAYMAYETYQKLNQGKAKKNPNTAAPKSQEKPKVLSGPNTPKRGKP